MKRPARLALFTIIHGILFVFVFLKSLYFEFEGESGYDPKLAAESNFFDNRILPIISFPIPWIVDQFKPLPRIFSGIIGWVWFAANSFLWAICINFIWEKKGRTFTKRLLRAREAP